MWYFVTAFYYFCSGIIGYLLGSLSPSAMFAKMKNKDLRKAGTKNMGATNALLLLGKGYGAAVMLLDMAKAVLAVRLAELLFPSLALAGYIAGCTAVFGHVFPLYMKFKGGRGLASFGGFVLAVDWKVFLMLLVLGLILMIVVNYSFVMPFSAAFFFPILEVLKTKSVSVCLITLAASVLIIMKHWVNAVKAKEGNDFKIRDFIKDKIFS
ncbi:MAG: glycerol-3-phosphate acyltransferase [Ruminococcaceae bacterium]|nr:glycerol-3-phosphate acyltransferase [Oscillospiraceae bacterium]